MKPDADGCELDRGEKVIISLVIAPGDGTGLLEFTEEALNEIAIWIKECAEDSALLAVWHGSMLAQPPRAAIST